MTENLKNTETISKIISILDNAKKELENLIKQENVEIEFGKADRSDYETKIYANYLRVLEYTKAINGEVLKMRSEKAKNFPIEKKKESLRRVKTKKYQKEAKIRKEVSLLEKSIKRNDNPFKKTIKQEGE